MKVLVYCEPPVNAWQGPCSVIAHEGNIVQLAVDGQVKRFSIEKVKEYLPAVAPINAAIRPPASPHALSPSRSLASQSTAGEARPPRESAATPCLDDVAEPVLASPLWELPLPVTAPTGEGGHPSPARGQ